MDLLPKFPSCLQEIIWEYSNDTEWSPCVVCYRLTLAYTNVSQLRLLPEEEREAYQNGPSVYVPSLGKRKRKRQALLQCHVCTIRAYEYLLWQMWKSTQNLANFLSSVSPKFKEEHALKEEKHAKNWKTWTQRHLPFIEQNKTVLSWPCSSCAQLKREECVTQCDCGEYKCGDCIQKCKGM